MRRCRTPKTCSPGARTKQTGPDGRRVQTLLIASGAKIKREFYLAVLLDRAVGRPLVMPAPRRHGHRGGRGQNAGKDFQGMD